MTIDKNHYLKIKKFPPEWVEWGMYPDQLAAVQLAGYEPGNEDSPEHDRNGAFHWWLKNNEITKEQLIKLVKLSYLDPDTNVGKDVRNYLLKANKCDEEIRRLIK